MSSQVQATHLSMARPITRICRVGGHLQFVERGESSVLSYLQRCDTAFAGAGVIGRRRFPLADRGEIDDVVAAQFVDRASGRSLSQRPYTPYYVLLMKTDVTD